MKFQEKYLTLASKNPVKLNDLNEPGPDVAIIRKTPGSYADAHPGPKDSLLIIEVSDSTLEFDTTEKLQLYAQSGIPEYWVVDIVNDQILSYSGPTDNHYKHCTIYEKGEIISFKVVRKEFSVDEIIQPG